MDRDAALGLLVEHPVEVGHAVGYRDLTELHNGWLREMLYGHGDMTLQAHRGSYKTTTLALFIAIHALMFPKRSLMYFRKTDGDVAEVMRTVQRILRSGCVAALAEAIYGHGIALTKESTSETTTSLRHGVQGTAQVVGLGIGTSVTGKHADVVMTDDIVNVRDRASRAEREATKRQYMELQNVVNRGGRLINSGTPWHKDDAFSLMPEPERWPWDRTGLVSPEQAADLRSRMTRSLFAANYELRHIADEGAILRGEPEEFADESLLHDGIMHVDAAYGGSDGTAVTCISWRDGVPYVHGLLWRETHVDRVMDRICELHDRLRLGTVHMERNADKGYLAERFRERGLPVSTYQERENKFVKVSTYARGAWDRLRRLDSPEPECAAYWDEVMDFSEGAQHDDAPDSLASAIRLHERRVSVRLFGGGI